MTKKILLLVLLIPIISAAQQQLTGNFSPKESFNWAIMYEITGTKVQYAKDGKVVDGTYQLALDSTVSKGMYRIVYGVPQEVKNFDFIYNGNEDVSFTFSEEEGVRFTASEENKKWQLYQAEMNNAQSQIDSLYAKKVEKHEGVAPLFTWQKQIQEGYEATTDTMMAGVFIRASRSYIPETFEDKRTYLENKKAHYFKNIDVTNSVLQKSTFLLERCLSYIETKEDTDAVTGFLKPTSLEYQRFILLQIWEDAVAKDDSDKANYLSKKHLTPIAEELNDTALVDKLYKYESLSIGAKAPNFSWEEEEDDKVKLVSLYDYEVANNYILVFWSSNCSHCLGELPKLQKVIQSLPEDAYKVIAFGLEDSPYEWKNETYRYPEFQHVLGLGKWENEVGNSYDVSKTPTYFVLDKDKIMKAKPDNFEALVSLMSIKRAEK